MIVSSLIARRSINNGNMLPNAGGYEVIKKHKGIAIPAIAFTYMTFFYVFHRMVGYNN